MTLDPLGRPCACVMCDDACLVEPGMALIGARECVDCSAHLATATIDCHGRPDRETAGPWAKEDES